MKEQKRYRCCHIMRSPCLLDVLQQALLWKRRPASVKWRSSLDLDKVRKGVYSKHMYTPGEFGKKIHVSVKTLQRWDREGVLRAHRTASNRRYYTQEDVVKILPEEQQTRRRR